MREKGRAGVYALAGMYLLYLAYHIFESRAESVGSEVVLIWIFIILFGILGIGLMVLGGVIMSRIHRREQEDIKKRESEQNNKNNERMP